MDFQKLDFQYFFFAIHLSEKKLEIGKKLEIYWKLIGNWKLEIEVKQKNQEKYKSTHTNIKSIHVGEIYFSLS